jgi:multicomponent Na+:H+ antiporter subunit A
VAWAPTWDLRLAFELDGLAALYGLLASGIGALVFTYASAYVPRHLEKQDRPRRDEARLHGAMALFLVSMIGLVTAKDLIALFVFWDLTAVASWLLISFDRHDLDARLSALMALLVTAISAVLMLVGILMLRSEYGTTQLDELFAVAEQGTTVTVACALIAGRGAGQERAGAVPLLAARGDGRATPVSAYLHSAAMVAAGVFLLSRVHPLLALEPGLLDALLVVGLASMAVGGVLALGANGLKRLLAYSTISQYGYVVTMLGVGGKAGAAAACFYVLAHAIAKSGLFMTAGAVTQATGAKGLRGVGGLARRMPLLAAGSAACAATIAALPLTIGFFKDELFFKAALERGTLLGVLAVAGAALTFAYMARFWTGIFLGPPAAEVEPLERRLVWPTAVLGLVAVAGGVVVGPFAELSADAAEVTNGAPAPVDAAYHLDARAENLMALAAYAVGLGCSQAAGCSARRGTPSSGLGERVGPERAYRVSLRGLNRFQPPARPRGPRPARPGGGGRSSRRRARGRSAWRSRRSRAPTASAHRHRGPAARRRARRLRAGGGRGDPAARHLALALALSAGRLRAGDRVLAHGRARRRARRRADRDDLRAAVRRGLRPAAA